MADISGWDIPRAVDPPEQQALAAILDSGLGAELEKVVIDGAVHRFKTAGDTGREKSGWYRFYSDNVPAGAFGTWRGDVCYKWCSQIEHELTADELDAMAANQARAVAEREAEAAKIHEAAAETVAQIWNSTPPADPSHAYLQRKQVRDHGLHETGDGRLIMPIYVGDKLTSLQYISADGSKLFHSGGEVAGGYFAIKPTDASCRSVYICEGYATGASIAEATGGAVIVALNAGNLLKVAPWVRMKLPTVDLVIVADNDENGVGQDKANRAAALSNARVIVPPQIGDANDYACAGHNLAALLVAKKPWLIKGRAFYKKPEPLKWLIKGWVQQNALMMCFGASGAGKTFFVLDAALTIAAGMTDWHGMRVTPGPVVYLAGEGHYGLKARIAAWVQARGRDVDDLYVSTSACDLNTDQGYQKVINEIESYQVRPALIVVDTLNRFMAGDENKADEARGLIDRCDALKQVFGCSVLIVHHTGVGAEAKDRARGSSAFKGAMDIEIKIESAEQAGALTAIQTKAKDSEAAAPLVFDKVKTKIDGWFDEDGEPVESLVLELSEQLKTGRRLTPNQKRGMDAFVQAAKTKGRLAPDGSFDGVHVDDWKDAFLAASDGKPAYARTLFYRVKKELAGFEEIKEKGDYVYLGGDMSELRSRVFADALKSK